MSNLRTLSRYISRSFWTQRAGMESSDYSQRFVSAGHSELYAKYRASHSKGFFKFMVEHLRQKLPAPNSLALDVGCGTGSSTRPLAEYFDHVVGCDISDTQVAEANKDASNPSNISFKMAPCDNLPAENGSVDLVTVSEAIHWFIPLGIEKFYHEVDRVLKPGGCLAIYEYGHAQFVNHPQHEEMNRANFELRTDERVWKYTAMPIRRERGLANIATPYDDVMRDSSFKINRNISLEEVVGEWRARSSFYLYYKDHPDRPGPLEEYAKRVNKFLGDVSPRDARVDLRYQVWLVMGRKPLQQAQ